MTHLNEEDSIFNSKLFLNLNEDDEQNLNDSYLKESENSNEEEEINSSCLLSKDLIEELNSNSEETIKSPLKNETINNNIESFISLDNLHDFNPKEYILFIQNNQLFYNDNRYTIFNKYNYPDNINVSKKKQKNLREKKKDWICPFCQNLNYGFRIICNRCRAPKKKYKKFTNNRF